MCVAIPVRVIEMKGDGRAVVDQNGTAREVSILSVPDVTIGCYVLINLGVAARMLTETEAREILDLWDQLNASLYEDQQTAESGQA